MAAANPKVKMVKLALGMASVTALVTLTGWIYQDNYMNTDSGSGNQTAFEAPSFAPPSNQFGGSGRRSQFNQQFASPETSTNGQSRSHHS